MQSYCIICVQVRCMMLNCNCATGVASQATHSSFWPRWISVEEQIPEGKHSFHFTGLQVIPFQEYTYCVTANTPYGQIDLKLTVNFTELQGGLKCDSIIQSVNGSSYSYSAEGYHKSKTNVWKCDRFIHTYRTSSSDKSQRSDTVQSRV